MSTIVYIPDRDKDADEAQAMLSNGIASQLDWVAVRDGKQVVTGHIEIPDEFYETALRAVTEQLTLARNEVQAHVPRQMAGSYANLFVRSNYVAAADARKVEAFMAKMCERAIDAYAVEARDQLRARLPLTLRSLIPMIRRRISQ